MKAKMSTNSKIRLMALSFLGASVLNLFTFLTFPKLREWIGSIFQLCLGLDPQDMSDPVTADTLAKYTDLMIWVLATIVVINSTILLWAAISTWLRRSRNLATAATYLLIMFFPAGTVLGTMFLFFLKNEEMKMAFEKRATEEVES